MHGDSSNNAPEKKMIERSQDCRRAASIELPRGSRSERAHLSQSIQQGKPRVRRSNPPISPPYRAICSGRCRRMGWDGAEHEEGEVPARET